MDLKEDYATELEGRVERLERRLKSRDRTIASMLTALRWFFDAIASSDRCKRAASGCVNRISPSGEFTPDKMAHIPQRLEDPADDKDDPSI